MSTDTEKQEADGHHFQKRLGPFDCTMLVAGSMIGSGIFIVSADMARDLNSTGWLLVAWVLTGVMTVIGALSYAELAAMMPHAGGQYVYLREAYSPFWGFLYGWTLFLVIQTGTIAAVGVAFAKFLGLLVPALGPGNVLFSFDWYLPGMDKSREFTLSAAQPVGVGIIVLLTLFNCGGVQGGKWIQNVFTVAKTGALIALIVIGLTVAVNPAVMQANFADPWSGIEQSKALKNVPEFLRSIAPVAILMIMGGAMVGSLFAADAWNNITFTAGEVKNPHRNLLIGLGLGTGLVILLYLLANVAYVFDLPVSGTAKVQQEMKDAETPEEKKAVAQKYGPEQLGIAHARDDRVGTAVLELVSPAYGVRIMAIAIIISAFGCANGLILMGARLYYAMAKDGLFFKSVGQLNSRGVPAAGLLLQCVWASLLTFSGTYSDLLDYIIFAALLFYVLTVIGLFVLRRRRPDAERPYKAVGYPVLPAIYVVLCAVIMVDLLVVKTTYSLAGLIIVLTGVPVYFLWRQRVKS